MSRMRPTRVTVTGDGGRSGLHRHLAGGRGHLPRQPSHDGRGLRRRVARQAQRRLAQRRPVHLPRRRPAPRLGDMGPETVGRLRHLLRPVRRRLREAPPRPRREGAGRHLLLCLRRRRQRRYCAIWEKVPGSWPRWFNMSSDGYQQRYKAVRRPGLSLAPDPGLRRPLLRGSGRSRRLNGAATSSSCRHVSRALQKA